jgi:predicted RNA binding protein YcfA (HicA-like mRNA interferase family)
MHKLPILSGAEIIKILKKFGFEELRQKGSHVSLKKDLRGRKIGCVVPLHKEVAIGTLKGILKQANISEEDFLDKVQNR